MVLSLIFSHNHTNWNSHIFELCSDEFTHLTDLHIFILQTFCLVTNIVWSRVTSGRHCGGTLSTLQKVQTTLSAMLKQQELETVFLTSTAPLLYSLILHGVMPNYACLLLYAYPSKTIKLQMAHILQPCGI